MRGSRLTGQCVAGERDRYSAEQRLANVAGWKTNKLTLEQRALASGAFYVDKIERDLDNGQLSFALVADPEQCVVVRYLVFTAVREFKELWDEEEDPDLMEQIIGLHEDPEEVGIRYIIRLDQSEMYFYSDTEPQLIEVSLSAL